jgi:hypothetical protein
MPYAILHYTDYVLLWIIVSGILLLIRYNFLNDLPSLDPELYRHLLSLKVRACFHLFLK